METDFDSRLWFLQQLRGGPTALASIHAAYGELTAGIPGAQIAFGLLCHRLILDGLVDRRANVNNDIEQVWLTTEGKKALAPSLSKSGPPLPARR